MYLYGHHAMPHLNDPTPLPSWASTHSKGISSFHKPRPIHHARREHRKKEHRDRWIVELREKRIALSRRVVSSNSIAERDVSQDNEMVIRASR
jgi:hypothetical protein